LAPPFGELWNSGPLVWSIAATAFIPPSNPATTVGIKARQGKCVGLVIARQVVGGDSLIVDFIPSA
jgi:hypothetical protein